MSLEHRARPGPMPPSDPDAPTDDGALDRAGRVFAVAVAWALPGSLFGGLAAAILSVPAWDACLVCGGVFGALAGGLVEADPWA